MFEWLAENWQLLLVAETALLVLVLLRPAPNWRLLLRVGRGRDVRRAAGKPGRFWCTEPTRQPAGAVARVRLDGPAASVRLVDGPNYARMMRGRRYAYVGGWATGSPFELTVPWAGRWRVVGDLGSASGVLDMRVRWIAEELPPISVQPVNTEPHLGAVRDRGAADGVRDVFVLHVAEDRDEVARPLAEALRARGATVWLDEFELAIGDSLAKRLERGLACSRFGVVVLSPGFFEPTATGTPRVEGDQVVLPVLHRITRVEALEGLPWLADLVVRGTSDRTVDEIAEEIALVVLPDEAATEEEDDPEVVPGRVVPLRVGRR
ncbi:DUF1883 domain-containing protein [Saccharothrix syringae]|uniref:DUF1883 domain-containing protein n=1 Tax=Saccharothrix syringae TaxID=103733 RepID=A0A5Q0GRK6_SACSY|nr:DUF1883 domain-containing protein [Saccharothrix syringae]QFZ16716.1 DUF1883 domain-containing protein [Saccharothrix syringae]